MKSITIKEVNDKEVSFTSALGDGIAIWCGDAPLEGRCYSVELDIDDVFEWGRNIGRSIESTTSIKVVDNSLSFSALVVSYENDGTLALSLNGAIIFLEVSSYPGGIEFVSFFSDISKIALYPIDL